MRALIADDEPIARELLREHLAEFPGVEVVGEADNGIRAVAQISKLAPDLVFLDLQMPELDGFAVARSLLGSRLPLVVFVTAYDNRALDAFHIGAVDYLLKPIRRERLAAAIDRARERLRQSTPPPPRPVEALNKIVGRLGDDYHVLEPAEVIAFVADGDTAYVLSSKSRFLSNHTLKQLEERLPSPPFRRIRRNTIINAAHIRKISPLSSKRWLLTMSNGLEVIVSKRLAGMIRGETGW